MQHKLNCLVVDDEQLARELLVSYLEPHAKVGQLTVCKDCQQAKKILNQQAVDLVFMDVEMPGTLGIEFIRSENPAAKVIFTTAYRQFAVESYDLNAVDYLLKPIGEQRFQKALAKAERLILQESVNAAATPKVEYLTVKVGHSMQRIAIDQIVYVKALREYVQFYLFDERVTSLMAISEVEEKLAKWNFLRIHRSFLVAKDRVKMQNTNSLVLQNGAQLPLGRTYKKQVLKALYQEP